MRFRRIKPWSNKKPVDSFEAMTALPYENLARATAALRGQLKRQLLEEGRTADWTTFTVLSPTLVLDGRLRPWFEYRATVAVCISQTS